MTIWEVKNSLCLLNIMILREKCPKKELIQVINNSGKPYDCKSLLLLPHELAFDIIISTYSSNFVDIRIDDDNFL